MKLIFRMIILLGLTSQLMAQDFSKEWQAVDQDMQKRLPKSAYEKANNIFQKALETNNQEQIVKSIFYLQSLSSQLEEIEYDSRKQKEIKHIENNITKVSGGARSIVLSFLAEKYSQFYDQNYWKIKDRTTNSAARSEDMSLWSLDEIEDKIKNLYLESIQDINNQKIAITNFKQLISNTESKYCTTLYDFLCYRAIQGLSNERHYMTETSPKIDFSSAWFQNAKTFVSIDLAKLNSESKKLETLKLYQKLLAVHFNDTDPSILIDIDLQRLAFIYQNYEGGDKDDIYEAQLRYIFNQYKSYSESFYALLALAQLTQQSSHLYTQTKDTAFQWQLKKTIEIYDQIMNECSDADIINQAKNSKNGIIQNISYTAQLEKVYIPNRPILARLDYTNINKIFYRIYPKKIDLEHLDQYQNQKEFFEKLLNNSILKSGSYSLNNPGDYLGHSVELDIPALENGNYSIVFSLNENFNFNNNHLQSIAFSVSNLAYFIHKDQQNNSNQLYVVDRSTGQPMPNTTVDFYQSYWTNKRMSKLLKSDKTNSNAKVDISFNPEANQNYFFILKYNDDILYELQEDYLYHGFPQNEEQLHEDIRLFLDRAIYRPGQTIYFKGIAYQTSNKSHPKILTNKSIEVSFLDANSQEIAKTSLVTNDFGTFHGSFTAPSSGLLGVMHLNCNQSYMTPVRVEEYKRPSFEVIFDTFRQQAKLGDMIRISGKGKTYSGANLPNANVKYSVVRRTSFPYWRCWWIPMPSEEKQIAHGNAKTDENGNFNFDFKAEKGRKNSWDRSPIYQYTINVEMADITGEIQTGSSDISIGTIDFQIQADVKENYNYLEKIQIPISIQNLDGNKIEKTYQVQIYKLIDPTILYQKRYWEVPEMQAISEGDFRNKFPAIPLNHEDRIENYKLSTSVFQISKTHKLYGNEMIELDAKTWKSGAYKMIVSSKDINGKEVNIERYFHLMDDKKFSMNQPVIISKSQPSFEPSQMLKIDVFPTQLYQKVFTTIQRKNQGLKSAWKSAQEPKIEWLVTEEDRGGAYILWTSVWNNRFYSGQEYVPIPWTNKELEIEFSTFRDKLAPEQLEEWQLKIKGKKGDKILAEVLANMYDQSLDVFAENTYAFFPYSSLTMMNHVTSHTFNTTHAENSYYTIVREKYHAFKSKIYPHLIWQDIYHGGYLEHRGGVMMAKSINRMASDDNIMEAAAPMATMASEELKVGGGREDVKTAYLNGVKKKEASSNVIDVDKKNEPIKVRTNLNETVFFKPNLMTDKDGNLIIKFKMNEALTKWKFMALATSKELQVGYAEKSILTQKDLMIQPNAPRFLRENDEYIFSARITNLSDKKLTGWVAIELLNAATHNSVNEVFGLQTTQTNYEIEAGQTKSVEWKLIVPEKIDALTYRVIAQAGNFSDGEENTIPVLSNRMLVTETMPFYLRANSQNTVHFKDYTDKNSSTSLHSKVFTIEYSANPVWYAIQSLPYLMEYPYECTEQIFNRYFSNTLSKSIVNRFPKIQSVFESWKGTDAMLSNLSKNQSLKSALLEETPWVMAAQSEEEQRKNIAILFDIHRLAKEEKSAIDKLYDRQQSDGSFPWFPGGYVNPYMTQYVLEGMGHLDFLKVIDYHENPKIKTIVDRGILFLDDYIVKHYEEMKKWTLKSGGKLSDDHLDPFSIHYLYTRSFFKHPIPLNTQKVIDYYHNQGIKYWTNKSMYQEGMLALYYHRSNESKTTRAMMKSFRERAKMNEEKGMYWDNEYGYYWYQLPIETHSLMTEVFENLSDDQTEKDNLKLFLIKNKQTNRWATTKATASAIYALLCSKNDKLDMPLMPSMKLGDERIDFSKTEAEKGTGYFQKTWVDEQIKPDFSKLEVTNPNQNIAWGAIYWQYTETLNKIKKNESTPLKLQKKLYIVVNSDKGEQLVEATKENIKLGDKVRVRLTLMVEREMEFLHLKDMRASGFEPKDAISGYKWPGALGYYQTTRDASMNFFIDRIDKGTYTIEYDLFTNAKGKFSNGISTFQSMYAPEFNSHSEGLEVEIR